MGFFRKAFRGGSARAPSFVPTSFPFSGEIRLVHRDYDRLATGWWKVTVASAEEWQAKIGEMQQGVRNHFGNYQTRDGRTIPRWTEETWSRVRERLVIERR